MSPEFELVQRAVERMAFEMHIEFVVATIIGIAGLVFSLLAFLEAKKAKRAATNAGRIVRIQTISIELSEISQKLDKLERGIKFEVARDALNETTKKVLRFTAPFARDADPALAESIDNLVRTLELARESLEKVRPSDSNSESEAPDAVYNAIESHFAAINGFVATVLGLLETRTVDAGGVQ